MEGSSIALPKQICNTMFAALAKEAERVVSEFNAQGLANTVWACATVNLVDEKLFMALAREVERRASELNV